MSRTSPGQTRLLRICTNAPQHSIRIGIGNLKRLLQRGKEMRILNVHNSVNTSAVSLPHTSEAWLATNIPQFDSDVALGHFLHVEAHSWDHIFLKLARLREPAMGQKIKRKVRKRKRSHKHYALHSHKK